MVRAGRWVIKAYRGAVLAILLSAILTMGGCGFLKPQPTPTVTPMPTPTATPTPTPTPKPTPTPVPTPTPLPDVVDGKLMVSEAVLSYFKETCLEAEYGGARGFLIRWEKPEITVGVTGDYNDRLLARLDEVIAILNDIEFVPQLTRVSEDEAPDLVVQFGPYENMDEMIGYPDDDCFGFTYVYYDGDGTITSGYIGIANDISEADQDHALLEEMIQSLGPLQDSYDYEDSIFYQGYSTVSVLQPIDEAVVRLLYHPIIHAGMTEEAIDAVCTVID